MVRLWMAWTAWLRRVAVWCRSLSLQNLPRLRRRALSRMGLGRPMARRTWEGASVPEVRQASPRPTMPGRLRVPGRRPCCWPIALRFALSL